MPGTLARSTYEQDAYGDPCASDAQTPGTSAPGGRGGQRVLERTITLTCAGPLTAAQILPESPDRIGYTVANPTDAQLFLLNEARDPSPQRYKAFIDPGLMWVEEPASGFVYTGEVRICWGEDAKQGDVVMVTEKFWAP